MGVTRISHKSKFAVPAAIMAGALLVTACQTGPALGNVQSRGTVTKAPQVFDSAAPSVMAYKNPAGVTTTYLYGSGNNKKVPVRVASESKNTVANTKAAWASGAVDAMPTRPAWVNPSKSNIESPSVVRMSGKFMLFFSASRNGATDKNNDRCIGKATSLNPMGPFTPEAAPIFCGLPKEAGSNSWGRGAQSPGVFQAADGSFWMTAAVARTDTPIVSVKLTANGTVTGGINNLVKTGLKWHDGTDNTTVSGSTFLSEPSMIYEASSKTYLLFYQAGGWNTTNANVSFARCSQPSGGCTLDTRGPFLKSGAARTGPTGLSVYKGADGKLRVAYATWQKGKEGQSGTGGVYSRQTHFQTLSVTGGTDPAKQTVKLAN